MLEQYPTKSSSAVPFVQPPKINFAVGTRFTSRNKRHSDLMRRSTFNIKPMRRNSLTRYRAPAATTASFSGGEYQSVTKRDFTYPNASLLRVMNPNPKWIYRSNSDLGLARHFSGNDYQYFNSERGRSSTRNTSVNDYNLSDIVLDTEEEEDERSDLIKGSSVTAGSPDPNGVPENSREFLNDESNDNTYAFYKPLVGDSRDRYIHNAQFKRAVETTSPLEKEADGVENAKRNYIPRPVRFTDTFNKAFVPRPTSNANVRIATRLPVIKRYKTTLDPSRLNNELYKADRTAVYQKQATFQALDKDMMRTYDKQAKLKELLQK